MQLEQNKRPEPLNIMVAATKPTVTREQVCKPKLKLATKVINSKQSVNSAVSNGEQGFDFVGIAG